MNLLKGNFDILLLNTCSFSCSHCCFLELPNRWSASLNPKFVWSFDKILEELDHYSNKGIGFEELTLLGGEPTRHPRFSELVNTLQRRREHLFSRLKVVSNMTNLAPEILISLATLDRVIFSIYEVNQPILEALEDTGILDWLQSRTVVEFWNGDEFDIYGEPDSTFEGTYNQAENWSRCSYKGGCRVISPGGISYCHMAYARNENVESFDSEKVENYLNRTTPLKSCSVCPIPAKREKWTSLNYDRDKRSASRGVELVKKSAAILC